MSDDEQGAIGSLRLAVDRLTQALQLMLETQATHTEMLHALLAASAAPVPAESPIAEGLAGLAATLRAQTGLLGEINTAMARLPGQIGGEVEAGLRRALREVL